MKWRSGVISVPTGVRMILERDQSIRVHDSPLQFKARRGLDGRGRNEPYWRFQWLSKWYRVAHADVEIISVEKNIESDQ